MSKIDLTHTLQDVLRDHDLWSKNKGRSRADLSGANLSRAKNVPHLFIRQTQIVPQSGAFTRYKKSLREELREWLEEELL